MNKLGRKQFVASIGAGGAAALLAGCNTPKPAGTAAAGEVSTAGLGNASAIIAERGLTPADVAAALKTFVPPGKHDEYLMFASGGHSGQVVVMGLPSMRIFKVIPVFTPDAYTGWGYSKSSTDCLNNGCVNGRFITHGDTHHPALSETNGDYDGEYCFINDKVNGRVAVIDLKRFETTQIVKNPHAADDHGHCVTPNTEYVIETSQYGAPIGGEYVDLTPENYIKYYRGVATYWKFDRSTGKIDPARSFSIELPPYNQDLTDAGKLVSEGWSSTNSFNSELAIPQGFKGGLFAEAGMSQNAADWLHVINWKAAQALVESGAVSKREGMLFITLDQAIAHNLLFLIPETKSPHGVDVTPDGRHIIIAGKLDPHAHVYSFARILAATNNTASLKKDRYGIPIIPVKQVIVAEIPVGLGPLHTQFDNMGYAYTSAYLDSAVAKWKIGDENGNGWEIVDKLPLQYNTGHLAAPHGDTVNPRGGYVIGLNKWSIDRFTPVGPLYPRNLELVDTGGHNKMSHLYDAPIGMAEPHYAQVISTSLLKPMAAFPMGFDSATGKVSPDAPKPGNEGVRDDGETVTVSMTQVRSHFLPDVVKAKRGQRVVWRITNVEGTPNTMHGFALSGYNMSLTIEPGKMSEFTFVADKPGVYPFYCTDFCSALHLEMMGYFLVS